MSHYINSFLSTELTCIPDFVDKYIGKYYSNTAGNALTWAFLLWNILHLVFDVYLNVLLKKMQFKSFARQRLLRSLWFVGFYSASFVYCAATIVRNNMSVWDYKRHLASDGGPVAPHIMLGLGLFGSFFLHMLFWDMVKKGLEIQTVCNFLLKLLPLFTYLTRRIELYLSLLAMISLVQFVFNMLRFITTSAGRKRGSFLTGLLYLALGLFLAVHMLAIPLVFIIPLIFSYINGGFSVSMMFLSIILCSWWVFEILASPLYKYVNHWIYHCDITNERICPATELDCILFGPRDDVAFNLHMIRKEIKQRQDRLIQKRKPKNRGVLIQTLKCMVAIKKKLVRKRNPDSSEESSDSETEKDKAEKDSGSEEEESSSDENSDLEDDEKREAKEYKEETARALMEDREGINFRDNKTTTEDTKEVHVEESERREGEEDTKEVKKERGIIKEKVTKEVEAVKAREIGEVAKEVKEEFTEPGDIIKDSSDSPVTVKEIKEGQKGGEFAEETKEGEVAKEAGFVEDLTEIGEVAKEAKEGEVAAMERKGSRKVVKFGKDAKERGAIAKRAREVRAVSKEAVEVGEVAKEAVEDGEVAKEATEDGKDTKERKTEGGEKKGFLLKDNKKNN